MTLRPEFSMHHSGFEDFLFAPIWEEDDGSVLSILSAFARLGLDPWGEAARLAALPKEKAASALTVILTRLPTAALPRVTDPAVIRGLVDLLPDPATSSASAPGGSGDLRFAKATLGVVLAVSAALILLQAQGWLF